MPTVSRFYGISIIMRQREKEHNPPHIHAQMDNFDTPFLIQNGEIMAGEFPAIGRRLVKKFILEHRDELLEMWETGIIKSLPPLQ